MFLSTTGESIMSPCTYIMPNKFHGYNFQRTENSERIKNLSDIA